MFAKVTPKERERFRKPLSEKMALNCIESPCSVLQILNKEKNNTTVLQILKYIKKQKNTVDGPHWEKKYYGNQWEPSPI